MTPILQMGLLVAGSVVFHGSESVLLHAVHETLCEMEWNDQTHTVEVALRLHASDEHWVETHHKSQVADVQPKSVWQQRFLSGQIVFDPAGKEWKSNGQWKIRWIGRKEEGAHVWWFFEVVSDSKQPPQTIRSRLLFDREPDFQHRITLLGQRDSETGKSKAVILTKERPTGKLPFSRKPPAPPKS